MAALALLLSRGATCPPCGQKKKVWIIPPPGAPPSEQGALVHLQETDRPTVDLSVNLRICSKKPAQGSSLNGMVVGLAMLGDEGWVGDCWDGAGNSLICCI